MAVGGQLLAGGFLILWLHGSWWGWGLKFPLFWTSAVRRGPLPFLPAVKRAHTARVATGRSQPIVLSFSQPHETTIIVGSDNATVEEAGTDVRVAMHSHLGMASHSWGNVTAYVGRLCPKSCPLVKKVLWLAGGVAGAIRGPGGHLDGTMQIVEIVRRKRWLTKCFQLSYFPSPQRGVDIELL